MSVSTTSPLTAPATIAVAPTETVVISVSRESLRGARRVTVQIRNLDATQTFVGIVYRKKAGMSGWAASSIPDFASIGPVGSATDSAMADLDVEGTDFLELRGTMSGAGGNVEVGATRKAAAP